MNQPKPKYLTLYRGIQEVPVFAFPELRARFEVLLAQFNQIKSALGNDTQKWTALFLDPEARKPVLEYMALRDKLKTQLFSDQKHVADHYADEEGFVIEMTVPQDVALEHHADERYISSTIDEGGYMSGIYRFSAEEIYDNNPDWPMNITRPDHMLKDAP